MTTPRRWPPRRARSWTRQHIGVSILYFKLRYPDAYVTGVEPDPAAFEPLRRNTAPLEHVDDRHAAVGAT